MKTVSPLSIVLCNPGMHSATHTHLEATLCVPQLGSGHHGDEQVKAMHQEVSQAAALDDGIPLKVGPGSKSRAHTASHGPPSGDRAV